MRFPDGRMKVLFMSKLGRPSLRKTRRGARWAPSAVPRHEGAEDNQPLALCRSQFIQDAADLSAHGKRP